MWEDDNKIRRNSGREQPLGDRHGWTDQREGERGEERWINFDPTLVKVGRFVGGESIRNQVVIAVTWGADLGL